MVFKTDGFYNSMDEVPKYYTANKEVQLIYDNDTRMVYLPGARKLVDLNGDGRITAADKYAAASPLPKAHGGFINEIRWKNFRLPKNAAARSRTTVWLACKRQDN